MNRRETVKVLAAGVGFWLTPLHVQRAAAFVAKARSAGRGYEPKFFTPHEWETMRVLVDLVIPRDGRSGSATDHECDDRYGKTFVACADAERVAVLDDIAWPKRAKSALAPGVAFFNGFRDLTASGFWSSKMGVQDLRYMGNVVVPEWKGCPDEQLKKLGVRYP